MVRNRTIKEISGISLRRLLPFLIPILLCLVQQGSGRPRVPNHSLFKNRNRQLFDFAKLHGYSAAIPLYRQAADDAIRMGDTFYSIRFLNNVGACQLLTSQFQDALRTFLEAKELALRSHDRKTIAGLNSNISSLYWQMGNHSEAVRLADEAVQQAAELEEVPRASLYAQMGTMQARMGQLDRAEDAFAKSIDLALDAAGYTGTNPPPEPGALEMAALAWDSLAFARRKAGQIEAADEAASQGFRLRKILHSPAVDSSYVNLAAIRAAEGDLSSALHLMDEAENGLGRTGHAAPAWRVYLERGKIELGAGQLEPALRDLRKSRDLVRDWRIAVVANDANRTSSETELAEDLYEYLIQAGNELYLAKHNEELIRETFESEEENRAASLRALLPQKSDWRKNLPARYYKVLASLKANETASLTSRKPDDTVERMRLRSDLERMEAEAGSEAPKDGNSALHQAMRALDSRSALFSFQLGESQSWLWTVTTRGVSLYRIAPRQDLIRLIRNFQSSVSGNQGDLQTLGGELYRALFGSVDREVLSRERWILLLDRELFELPFPALSPAEGRFLIEDHSLEIASGALMLKPNGLSAVTRRGFLGVGDPIYNLADTRARESRNRTWPGLLMQANYRQTPALARLWGTGREIEVSARAWDSGSNTLLKGADASPENLWAAAGSKPDIIHFATHIIESNEQPRSGWIALSLGANRQIQYITPADILARTITARLVILSGCSSGKADAPTATGLMGLTRAWIAAGAGAVLATRWPTVDDDGAFFEAFYRNLRQGDNIDPTEALRHASLDMLKTKNWRSAPSFWAGYFLVGNS